MKEKRRAKSVELRAIKEFIVDWTYDSVNSSHPFTLSLWFDKLTMIGANPTVLSLSKDKLSTNGSD